MVDSWILTSWDLILRSRKRDLTTSFGPTKGSVLEGKWDPCFKEMWADYYIDGIFLDFFECAPQKMGPDELGKGSRLETVTEMSKEIAGQTPKGCQKSKYEIRIPCIKKRWVRVRGMFSGVCWNFLRLWRLQKKIR